jgi:ArsR family transcriptional regulator
MTHRSVSTPKTAARVPGPAVQFVLNRLRLIAVPARLAILCTLAEEGTLDVGSLINALDMSRYEMSHHLAQLHVAGLVEKQRRGKYRDYSLTPLGRRYWQMATIATQE